MKLVCLLLPAVVFGGAVRMTPAEITEIVNAHNQRRAGVSPEASDMKQVVWDKTLEDRAFNWANPCKSKDNDMIDHPPMKVYSKEEIFTISEGENIYGSSKVDKVSAAVTSWDSEKLCYDYEKDKCTPFCKGSKVRSCDHYTQVAFSLTTKIGCTRADCPAHTYRYQILCRYQMARTTSQRPGWGFTAAWGVPKHIYKKGKPCSTCPNKCVGGKLCGKAASPVLVGASATATDKTIAATTNATPEKNVGSKNPAPNSGSSGSGSSSGSSGSSGSTGGSSGGSSPSSGGSSGGSSPSSGGSSGGSSPSSGGSSGGSSPSSGGSSGSSPSSGGAASSGSGVPKGCKATAKDLNEQNDIPDKVDFQKPILTFDTSNRVPPFPVCTIEDSSLGGSVSVREAFEDGWSCVVENDSTKDLVVRVQTTTNSDNPFDEKAWDFYYFAPKGQMTLANPGHGGDNAVCRLCGVAPVDIPPNDRDSIKALEQASYQFQCQRRCHAVMYQHRNFNGLSATISMNLPNLKSVGLENPAKISSLKIFGEGCELRLYEKPDFNGGKEAPVCSFKVPTGSQEAAYDMDALRTQCCNERCPLGQDCVKSIAIRDTKSCGPARSGGAKPGGCPSCYKPKRNAMTQMTVPARAQHLVALQRLFKAMADVLED